MDRVGYSRGNIGGEREDMFGNQLPENLQVIGK